MPRAKVEKKEEKKQTMDKKYFIAMIFVVLLVFTFVVGTAFGRGITTPIDGVTVTRTCDFVSIDKETYVFCEDGSEFRVADAFLPDSPK